MQLRSGTLLALLVAANVAAHLPGVTDPIGGHHAWRQADTAAIARNYVEVDGNFFRPRIDYLGNATGVTGTEFPIYSYLVALGYRAFGQHLALARGLSIACSCVALWATYTIATAWLGTRVGLASTVVLACSPIFFHYARNVQPDVMMVAMGLLGVACFLGWERTRRAVLLPAAAIALAVAATIKPYALVFLAPVAVGERPAPAARGLVIAAAVGATVAWYAFARHLTESYGGFRYFGGFLYAITAHPLQAAAASLGSRRFFTDVLLRGIRKLWVGYVGAVFLAIGVIALQARPVAVRRALAIWIALALVWIVLAGRLVAVHEYYALPLVPALAIVAGAGVDRLWSTARPTLRMLTVALLLAAPVLPLRHSARLRAGNLDPALVNVEQLLDGVVPREARIVIGPDTSPVVALYHAHRRGWAYPTVATPTTLGDFIARGASVLVSSDPGFHDHPAVKPYLARELAADRGVRVFALTGTPPPPIPR